MECIVQGDELSTSLENQSLSSQDEEKIHKGNSLDQEIAFLSSNDSLFFCFFLGFMANEFLKDTATQLTYYGLDLLLDSIPNDSLCVLFRNNHVIYQ